MHNQQDHEGTWHSRPDWWIVNPKKDRDGGSKHLVFSNTKIVQRTVIVNSTISLAVVLYRFEGKHSVVVLHGDIVRTSNTGCSYCVAVRIWHFIFVNSYIKSQSTIYPHPSVRLHDFLSKQQRSVNLLAMRMVCCMFGFCI